MQTHTHAHTYTHTRARARLENKYHTNDPNIDTYVVTFLVFFFFSTTY